MGYLLGNPEVIREFIKVRQPYSVDAVSQAIARVVYRNRAKFERGIIQIIDERARVFEALAQLPGVVAYPSNANYILFHVEGAGQVWQQLYDRGILVRDFSRSAMLEDCLRVSIGSPEENSEFLNALREILAK